MSDPKEPTTDALEPSDAFRETFLMLFTDPRDNAAWRRMESVLAQAVLDFSRYFPDRSEPCVVEELRAAARDLRHLEIHLGETVASNNEPGADPVMERRLTSRADTWAAQVAAIATEIEEAIAE